MTKSARAGLFLVFAIAVAVRVGWVLVHYGPHPAALGFPDEEAYLLSARSLAAGRGLVDEFGYRATYMPGYPAFLAAFEVFGVGLMAVRLTQAVLAALVAPATWLAARQWTSAATDALVRQNDHRAECMALWAGLAAAVDPFLVFFSGLLLTEALFAPLLVVAWWLTMRLIDSRRPVSIPVAAAAGLAVAGCIMLRPAAIILIPLVPGVLAVYRHFAARAVAAAAVTCVVVLLSLFPWAARNAGVLGEWRWTTTRGGISLYDGFQPGSTGASDLAHTKPEPGAAGLDELSWDRYWRDRALDEFRRDPGRLFRLAGLKFLRTWNLIPNEPGHRGGLAVTVSAVWMLGVLASAAAGLWQVRRALRWWLALLIPVAAFTLLHMVFVGSVRYRVPLMPLVFVLSAAGIGRFLCHPDARRETPTLSAAQASGEDRSA